jgi:hypothetical protein
MTASSLIVIGVAVVLVFAIAYGLNTVRGSGINLHRRRSQDAPGASGPSEPTGVDQGEGSATDLDSAGASDPQHGTK